MVLKFKRPVEVLKTLAAGIPYLIILFFFLPPVLSQSGGNISAIWANDGGDKVIQSELRATANAASVHNSMWDGTTVSVFGAKNEVVNFNLILEAPNAPASNVQVSFNQLTGPGNFVIDSVPVTGDGIFDWTERNIELFYVDYLQIKGISRLEYNTYDERHIPEELQRPWTGNGVATGDWTDRPNHDEFYPDIAVPLELVPTFNIAQAQNQSIWVDIYIPKNAPSGAYTGTVVITEGAVQHEVPVELTVRNFSLPEVPSSKTMLYMGYPDVNTRYFGEEYPSDEDSVNLVMDRHFQLAHRHRISLIGADDNDVAPPVDPWLSRLDGSLFTAANGYDGPGVGVGNNVFSIGTYGTWRWDDEGESAMRQYSDEWVNWFDNNSPDTEYFLYLIDESNDYPQIQQWAQWLNNNPGPGQRLRSLATLTRLHNGVNVPNLDIIAALGRISITDTSQTLADLYTSASDKRLYYYNGSRPATGTFTTEDDGIALRMLAWSQYKMDIDRWFYWESTYYKNFHAGAGQTNVFETAHTFGPNEGFDSVYGETGNDYSNGAGVLFYPGTDTVFPANSYGVQGPLASLRLKHWRRGIQDVDYLTMAYQVDPDAVDEIVNSIVPKVLWEYGVEDISDPTWVLTNISWSTDPDVWETARDQLAAIIEGAPNDIPLASNDTATMGEDDSAITIDVLTNDSDVNSDPLTISGIDSTLTVGAVVNNGTSIQYNPSGLFNHLAQGASTTDTFSYTVSDGKNGSAVAQVTVTITGLNDAPIAANDTYTISAGATLTIAAPGVLENDIDFDNQALTATILSDVSHGTLAFNGDGGFIYMPGSTFDESDSFTYRASDALSDSNAATVTITSFNTPPFGSNDSYTTAQNISLDIPVPGVLTNDTDAENDPLTAIKTGDPVHGSLTLNANGSFTYTPEAGFSGGDSFTYKVTDGIAESGSAIVTIWVEQESQCPAPPGAPAPPPFTWTLPGGAAEWFNIVLANDQMSVVFDEWFPAQQICNGASCSYTPDAVDLSLPNSSYRWWWRSWANDSFSNWSDENIFTVNQAPPQPPAGFTVSTHQGRPSLHLPQDPNALWYEIYIGGENGETLDLNWYPRPSCCGSNCIHPNVFPINGNFVAYIRAWGPGGFSTGGEFDGWAGPVNFSINFPAPDPVGRHMVNHENSGSPAFSWQGTAGATWYWLYVGTSDFSETPLYEGYSAYEMGCEDASICTILPDTLFLDNNKTYVWYVKAWGPGGYSQNDMLDGWTLGGEFTVSAANVQRPAPLTPTGNISLSAPTYTWAHTPEVSWYQIEISKTDALNAPLHLNWYAAQALNCFDNGVCEFKPDDFYLPQGSYSWRIQGYSPVWTEDTWSDWINFSVTF